MFRNIFPSSSVAMYSHFMLRSYRGNNVISIQLTLSYERKSSSYIFYPFQKMENCLLFELFFHTDGLLCWFSLWIRSKLYIHVYIYSSGEIIFVFLINSYLVQVLKYEIMIKWWLNANTKTWILFFLRLNITGNISINSVGKKVFLFF